MNCPKGLPCLLVLQARVHRGDPLGSPTIALQAVSAIAPVSPRLDGFLIFVSPAFSLKKLLKFLAMYVINSWFFPIFVFLFFQWEFKEERCQIQGNQLPFLSGSLWFPFFPSDLTLSNSKRARSLSASTWVPVHLLSLSSSTFVNETLQKKPWRYILRGESDRQ